MGPTVAMAGVVEYIEQSWPCIQTSKTPWTRMEHRNSTPAVHAAKRSNQRRKYPQFSQQVSWAPQPMWTLGRNRRKQFLGRPAHKLVTILTELPRLLGLIIVTISPYLQCSIICIDLHASAYSAFFQTPPTTTTTNNTATVGTGNSAGCIIRTPWKQRHAP